MVPTTRIIYVLTKSVNFKKNFFPGSKVLRSATKQTTYDFIVPSRTAHLAGHSSKLICLIICSNCYLQYEGLYKN